MVDFVEDVRKFHKKFKHPAPTTKQTSIKESVRTLRKELITSEFFEVKTELHAQPKQPDVKKLAKELFDLVYVLAGALVVIGERPGTDHGVDYMYYAIETDKYSEPLLNIDLVLSVHTSRVRVGLDKAVEAKGVTELARLLHDYIRFCTSIAHYFEIPVEAVWKEVQKSNMSKLWKDGKPRYYKRGPKKGKIKKPTTYHKADMDKAFGGKSK